ncbi:hypothetical protein H1R81_16760 [Emticicia sp. BO119]|nr:hypothetical protein [Emticicia sp. BO119]
MNVIFKLTEEEARALYNMTVYGADPFVKWFYSNLGKHYLKPHEDGLRSLFNTIKKELPPHFDKIDKVRKSIKDT